MVSIRRRTPAQLRQWTARILPSLIAHWEDLPQMLDEMDMRDPAEQMTYVEDWRLRENQRIIIQNYAAKGLLADSQLQQLTKLQNLAIEHEQRVSRLLGVSHLMKLHDDN